MTGLSVRCSFRSTGASRRHHAFLGAENYAQAQRRPELAPAHDSERRRLTARMPPKATGASLLYACPTEAVKTFIEVTTRKICKISATSSRASHVFHRRTPLISWTLPGVYPSSHSWVISQNLRKIRLLIFLAAAVITGRGRTKPSAAVVFGNLSATLWRGFWPDWCRRLYKILRSCSRKSGCRHVYSYGSILNARLMDCRESTSSIQSRRTYEQTLYP